MLALLFLLQKEKETYVATTEPGTRVHVSDASCEKPLGWGTYLEEGIIPALDGLPTPQILLDSGQMIYGYQCYWSDIPGAPPFPERFQGRVEEKFIRVLEGKGETLQSGDGEYRVGENSSLGEMSVLTFEGNKHVVFRAPIDFDDTPCYLLAIEVGFPDYYSD